MKVIKSIIISVILAGCAANADNITSTNNDGWRTSCVSNRCFAGTFGKDGSPFQVYYQGNDGPFIMAGHHTDPTSKASVRIDDNHPVYVTTFNQFIADQTINARIREANEIVGYMRTGKRAVVRYSTFPRPSKETTVDLRGFPEAHAALLAQVHAPTKSVVAGHKN